MAPDVENMRGVSAVRVLSENDAFTLESFLAAAYDPRLTAFEKLLPVLFDDWRALDASDPLRASLRPHIETLQDWDFRWSVDSEATSLAVFWGEALAEALKDEPGVDRYSLIDAMADTTRGRHRVEALDAAIKRLIDDFGSDRVPWGDINRYQRNDGAITQTFDDDKPSLPVGFTSSLWGSLAAFHARTYPGTRRMYGTAGNSFVAAVEFGDRVRALAITAGGQSGDPASPHFSDQAQRYADGQLREVWFYREEVERNAERRYHPGE
jgi:acyl-homoserine-lactone acylase